MTVTRLPKSAACFCAATSFTPLPQGLPGQLFLTPRWSPGGPQTTAHPRARPPRKVMWTPAKCRASGLCEGKRFLPGKEGLPLGCPEPQMWIHGAALSPCEIRVAGDSRHAGALSIAVSEEGPFPSLRQAQGRKAGRTVCLWPVAKEGEDPLGWRGPRSSRLERWIGREGGFVRVVPKMQGREVAAALGVGRGVGCSHSGVLRSSRAGTGLQEEESEWPPPGEHGAPSPAGRDPTPSPDSATSHPHPLTQIIQRVISAARSSGRDSALT